MQDTSSISQERTLDLLKLNYQCLHSAYWECHKVFWSMTSIFLPITLTAFAWIVKDISKADKAILVISWFIAFSLLTYWFKSSRYLDSFNKTRGDRLKLLENYFSSLDRAVRVDEEEDFFKQYTLEYKGGIKNLTCYLYIVLVAATLGLLITKLNGK